MFYIEIEGRPIAVELDDPRLKQQFDHDPHVASTYRGDGALWVSTVFLSINHGTPDAPLLYETMVFLKDDWSELAVERYADREAAQRGHAVMLARIDAGEFNDEIQERRS